MIGTVAGYIVLAAAAIGLEVAARRPDARIPTVGDCLCYVMSSPVVRVAVALGWLWVGWHFFAR